MDPNPKIFVNQIEDTVMDASNDDGVFNSTTNWRVAGGSLTDSISFESSSFSPNHESADTIISSSAVAKSPLLLLQLVPVCEPCEITITFAQAHELRQIYIRSSARVYEVYYTKKPRQDKEYLCTVRCGIATREEIPPACKDNGNEDDWVQVKTSDDSLLKQDCFEATAEICDAEPCISITLRLLSLQNKGCALVGEVYVYADPIGETESEQEEEASGAGNSSSSSALMAMFMPTLLQLSRGRERDGQVFQKPNSTNPKGSDDIQQEKRTSEAYQSGGSSLVLDDTLAEERVVSEAETKPTVSCDKMEFLLHQLVNKVTSLETMLTRFEDQMLKPINSIDARLQLVEKKLEELGKKSSESELANTDSSVRNDANTVEMEGPTKNQESASCTQIVVSDFQIKSTEDFADVLGSEHNPVSGNYDMLFPAESEMTNDDVGHSIGGGPLEEKPKYSINDALASALDGLLSSTSTMDRGYSQALVVTAPECSNEDDMIVTENAQTGTHADKLQDAADSASESPISSHKQSESSVCVEADSEEMIKGTCEKSGVSMGGDDDDEAYIDEETMTSNREAEFCEMRNPDDLVLEANDSNVTTSCGIDDFLKSALGFQPTNYSVNFLTPLLDVEFKSESKVLDGEYFFEALSVTESKGSVDCSNEEEAFDDQLVSIEDEDLKGPATDTLLSIGMDHHQANEMHHLEVNADTPTTSLI